MLRSTSRFSRYLQRLVGANVSEGLVRRHVVQIEGPVYSCFCSRISLGGSGVGEVFILFFTRSDKVGVLYV